MKKRVLSLILALTLCLSLMPTAVFAGDGDSADNVAVLEQGQEVKQEPAPEPEPADV